MDDTEKPVPPISAEEKQKELKERFFKYNADVVAGTTLTNRWIYAAAKRVENDLTRSDIYICWDEAYRLVTFVEGLSLVGEWSDKKLVLPDWQLWVLVNIWCWKWSDSKTRRYKLAVVSIGRGNGKTSLMSALALYDLAFGVGKRVAVVANSQLQAEICLDTSKTMVQRLETDHDFDCKLHSIECKDRDGTFRALPALERSLDGLSLSLCICDEVAEFKGRWLQKLLTTGAKRMETTTVLISTPASNPENIWSEQVKKCEDMLSQEAEDDTLFAALYGLDKEDSLDDETKYIKANPGLENGQPQLISLRRAWQQMKSSPRGRAEFSRYHGCRFSENTGLWLDMDLWEEMVDTTITEEYLQGRPCYGALDLSISGDATAFVLAFPLEDGRIYIKGEYWLPKEGINQKELDYRSPFRTWHMEGKLNLCAGREISYETVRVAINEAAKHYDLKSVAYDQWNSKMLAEMLISDGIPLQAYRMAISTLGPGSQIWEHNWLSKKLVFGNDPVMRRMCAEADAKTDINGNVRPVKSREYCLIDGLIAGIMALHSFGGTPTSVYETESEILNEYN